MKLIDLALWRKQNGLAQKDVADMLHVTRAYISQVETGTNSISDSRIDYLLFENDELFPCPYVLVPCFDRLMSLNIELKGKYELEYFSLVETKDYKLPLLGILSEDVILNIRHGRIPITEAIADIIIRTFPLVNKEWLTTGKGNIFIDDTLDKLQHGFVTYQEILDNIKIGVRDIGIKLNDHALATEKGYLKEILEGVEKCNAQLENVLDVHKKTFKSTLQYLMDIDSKLDQLLQQKECEKT